MSAEIRVLVFVQVTFEGPAPSHNPKDERPDVKGRLRIQDDPDQDGSGRDVTAKTIWLIIAPSLLLQAMMMTKTTMMMMNAQTAVRYA